MVGKKKIIGKRRESEVIVRGKGKERRKKV